MQFWHVATIYYILINIISFALYALDKKKAIAGKYRIPERTLIFFAFLGGGIGSLLGMYICHHKTQKLKFRILVPLWLVVHVAAILFFTYQNNHWVVTEYSMGENDNIKIVQLSDLHNVELWWSKDYIADSVKELNPDIIVITGDIVDSNHTDIDKALYTAGKLAEIADTYYVTGNHEYWLSADEQDRLYEGLKTSGVRILDNEFTYLDKTDTKYALIGLDDKSLMDGTLKEIINNVDEDAVTITLAHEPQYLSYYAAAGTDYVITGHAHGGQMNLLGYGPLVAPDQGFKPLFTSGVVEKDNTKMIISRGLGNSIIPFRVFNYPEIVVIDF